MKEKVLSSIAIIAILIWAMTVMANAASYTASMTASKTTVPESTEFTVTIKVSNLDVGTNGINSLAGYIKYDTDVFEEINDSSIEGLNSWAPTYDSSTGKVKLSKNTFVTSSQEVFQIAFKTKAGTSGATGTITFSNIVASNSEQDITASDISTTITIGNAEEPTGNTTSNQVTNITANTTNNTAVNNLVINTPSTNNTNVPTNGSNTARNNTTSYNVPTNGVNGTDMPYTGVDDYIVEIMLAVIGVALVFYIKFEKLNKDLR